MLLCIYDFIFYCVLLIVHFSIKQATQSPIFRVLAQNTSANGKIWICVMCVCVSMHGWVEMFPFLFVCFPRIHFWLKWLCVKCKAACAFSVMWPCRKKKKTKHHYASFSAIESKTPTQTNTHTPTHTLHAGCHVLISFSLSLSSLGLKTFFVLLKGNWFTVQIRGKNVFKPQSSCLFFYFRSYFLQTCVFYSG